MYKSRVVVYLLCLLAVSGTLYESTLDTHIIVLFIVLPLTWPHFCNRIIAKSTNLYLAECRLFNIDSFVCGFMLPLMGSHSLATLGIFNICLISQLMVNGPKGFIYHLIYLTAGALFNVTLVQFSLNAGHSMLEVVTALPLLIAGPALLGLNTFFLNRKLYEQKSTFKQQSEIDGLTGLYNRAYLENKSPAILQRCERENTDACLLLIDIDHFKFINDTFGHSKGDLVLVKLADILTNATRHQDIVCRYGGDELAVLLPDCSYKSAIQLAHRIRTEVEKYHFDISTSDKRITVSIGLTQLKDGETLTSSVNEADEALYLAKQQGRNKVIAY